MFAQYDVCEACGYLKAECEKLSRTLHRYGRVSAVLLGGVLVGLKEMRLEQIRQAL